MTIPPGEPLIQILNCRATRKKLRLERVKVVLFVKGL